MPYHCEHAQKMNFGGSRKDGSKTIVKPSEAEGVSTCFFGQSSFCNPTVAQQASCVKVDKDLPLSVVCALGCGFQTGSGSVYNVVKPLERKCKHLAIFGIGGVGCAAIMAANHLATSTSTSTSTSDSPFKIIAVDINDTRLELAKELGATDVINPNKESTREAIMRATDGEGVDAAIDCTGSMPVINEMLELIGPGGMAVTVGGPPPGSKVSIDVFDMLIKCKTYRGCHQGNAYSKTVSLNSQEYEIMSLYPLMGCAQFIPWLANLYSKGQFPLEKLQKRYQARDINQACQDMIEGKVLKPILVWD